MSKKFQKTKTYIYTYIFINLYINLYTMVYILYMYTSHIYIHIWFIHLFIHIYIYIKNICFLFNTTKGSAGLVAKEDSRSGKRTEKNDKEGKCFYLYI